MTDATVTPPGIALFTSVTAGLVALAGLAVVGVPPRISPAVELAPMVMQTVALGQAIWLSDATVTPAGMALLVHVGAAVLAAADKRTAVPLVFPPITMQAVVPAHTKPDTDETVAPRLELCHTVAADRL